MAYIGKRKRQQMLDRSTYKVAALDCLELAAEARRAGRADHWEFYFAGAIANRRLASARS